MGRGDDRRGGGVLEPGAVRAPGRQAVTDPVLRRIEIRSISLAAIAIAVARIAFGGRAAVSLTIGAAVAIFNFLFLEKVTSRFLVPRTRARWTDYTVPVGEILAVGLLVTLVLGWKRFDPVAGAVGLSVVVAAIGAEAVTGLWRS